MPWGRFIQTPASRVAPRWASPPFSLSGLMTSAPTRVLLRHVDLERHALDAMLGRQVGRRRLRFFQVHVGDQHVRPGLGPPVGYALAAAPRRTRDDAILA